MNPLPPGPRGTLRNTMRVMMDPYGFYADHSQKYGDIFTANTFNGKVICCMNSDSVRKIFSQPIGSFAPFAIHTAIPLVGKGSVMTNDGETHRSQRKLLSPPFKASRMGLYGSAMAETVHQAIDKLTPGQSIDMLKLANRISLVTIIRTVFGVQNATEQKQFIDAIDRFVAATNPIFIFCKPLQRDIFGFGPWAKFQKAKGHLLDLLCGVIHKRRQQNHFEEDILSRLLIQADEEAHPFTEEALLDNLVTLLFAGHETTGIALSWVMYWLHREPQSQQRLYEELNLDQDSISLDAIACNKWLDAVIKESLRLNPILGDVLRTLVNPLELQGYQLEPGLAVSVGIGGIHYRPDLYPDPHQFKPERFLERNFSPWEYMPFGDGTRRCPGSAFATYKLKIAVATLLQRCRFKLETPEIKAVRKNLTMAPKGGVPMTITEIRPLAKQAVMADLHRVSA